MPASPLTELRRRCLCLPETYEKEAWGSATFRVTKGKIFAMFAINAQKTGRARPEVWINSSTINQELLVAESPDRYFVPPYVGPYGWVGVWLDRRPPWKTVQGLLEDAWKRAAPKRLLKAVTQSAESPAAGPKPKASRTTRR